MSTVSYGDISGPTILEILQGLEPWIGVGWHVFPERVVNGEKVPAIKDWPNEASTDPRVIVKWWREDSRFAECVPGIVTGRKSMIFVVDIDVKNIDGFEQLQQLCSRHGTTLAILRTHAMLIVRTPSGGEHWNFRYPDGLDGQIIKNRSGRNPLVPGVDVRGDGGQVVAPNTMVPYFGSWGRYEVIEQTMHAHPPTWLINEVTATRTHVDTVSVDGVAIPVSGIGVVQQIPSVHQTSVNDAGSTETQPYRPHEWSPALRNRVTLWLQKALTGVADRLANQDTGGRNDALNAASYRMAGYAWTGLFTLDWVATALMEACRINGLYAEDPDGAVETLRSGWAAGIKNPLRLPGWVAEAESNERRTAVYNEREATQPSDVFNNVVATIEGPLPSAGVREMMHGSPVPDPEPLQPAKTESSKVQKTDTVTGDYFTDAALSETIAEACLKDRFIWTSAHDWLGWTGSYWRMHTSDETVIEATRQYIRTRHAKATADWAGAIASGDQSQIDMCTAMVDGWKAVGRSATRIAGIVRLMRGVCERDGSLFDQDPNILVCLNGVVNLRTGELLPHDPARMVTKTTGVRYDPNATSTDWDMILTCVPPDVSDWLCLRFGQAATGYMTSDDVMPILNGTGENGKGTLMTALKQTLGAYAIQVSDRLLMANPDAHPTELMDLQGVRLAVLDETPEARVLDTQRLKKTVGTEWIRARRMKKDTVEFAATHSLFVSTNHRPIVNETDHGTWRRLAIVMFPYTFRKSYEDCVSEMDRPGNDGLRERAKSDARIHQAVLAWLVRGARQWYENGMAFSIPPASVIGDTATWRAESDIVHAYCAERLEFELNACVVAAELLKDFNDWLAKRGQRPWSDKLLMSRLDEYDGHGGKQSLLRKVVATKSNPPSRPNKEIALFAPLEKGSYRAVIGLSFRDGCYTAET
jgi:P4 family phage/plasmid primase-like protien